MFMRVSWGRIRSGMWEEYERRFDKLAAEQSAHGGPRRRWLVRDLDDSDAGFAISFFDTQEEMRAWADNATARQRTQNELSDLYVGDYRTRQCEIRRKVG
jgi:heme-degrading monooxygenase HmoA